MWITYLVSKNGSSDHEDIGQRLTDPFLILW